MTQFFNVCGREENPKNQKVSWPKIGTIIKKDNGKMYLKLFFIPGVLFHCFLNEPRDGQQDQQQTPAPAPQQPIPATPANTSPEVNPDDEISVNDIPF